MNHDVTPKPPVPAWPAVKSLARCALAAGVLLAKRRIHLPRPMIGRRIRFADGTSSAVYRESVAVPFDRVPTEPRPARP